MWQDVISVGMIDGIVLDYDQVTKCEGIELGWSKEHEGVLHRKVYMLCPQHESESMMASKVETTSIHESRESSDIMEEGVNEPMVACSENMLYSHAHRTASTCET